MTRARGTVAPAEISDEQRVHDFADEARRFMALVSCPAPDQAIERARCLARACAALYEAAAELSELDIDEEEAIDEILEPALDLEVVSDWTRLGRPESYRLLVDPFGDDQPARASLHDDLDEVLAELAAGLAVHDSSPERWRAAAIEWRMDFSQGWGRHLAAVLYAAHCALGAQGAGDEP